MIDIDKIHKKFENCTRVPEEVDVKIKLFDNYNDLVNVSMYFYGSFRAPRSYVDRIIDSCILCDFIASCVKYDIDNGCTLGEELLKDDDWVRRMNHYLRESFLSAYKMIKGNIDNYSPYRLYMPSFILKAL